MPIGYDRNVMPYCIQIEAAARATCDWAFTVFTKPIEKVRAMSAMATRLTPKDPRSKRMTFAHFYVANGFLDCSVRRSTP